MAFSRRTSNASREAALEASRLEAILSFTAARATHAPRKAFVGLLKESHLLLLSCNIQNFQQVSPFIFALEVSFSTPPSLSLVEQR